MVFKASSSYGAFHFLKISQKLKCYLVFDVNFTYLQIRPDVSCKCYRHKKNQWASFGICSFHITREKIVRGHTRRLFFKSFNGSKRLILLNQFPQFSFLLHTVRTNFNCITCRLLGNNAGQVGVFYWLQQIFETPAESEYSELLRVKLCWTGG